jgi:hypothetical protein
MRQEANSAAISLSDLAQELLLILSVKHNNPIILSAKILLL